MKNTLIYTLIFLCISVHSQTPAFPTAEGYGKYATGGRGGKVVFVENLEDYISYNNLETPIPGSFRWALTQYPGEPLTIIFRVSGTIVLKPYLVLSGTSVRNQNDIRSSRAKLTIAGQTAPGEGITIRNGKVNLGGCTDLIVRNMRFRIGESAYPTPIYGYKVGGIARDTLAPTGSFLPGGSVGCENALRVIFDHCVFGWSGEENITMYDNRFTTVQWSNLHEGLYDDGHGKGNRSYGGQCGGINATWHHNLFAHNYSRSPRLNGARTDNEVRVFIEFINNLNYNWGRSGAPYGGELFTGSVRSHTANFVGNYYKPGPGTDASSVFFNLSLIAGANKPQWHVSGNVMAGNTSMSTNNWNGFKVDYSTTGFNQSQIASDTLLLPPKALVYNGAWIDYAPYKINIETAENAYQSVLNKVGTVNRDSVERRIMREVKNGLAIFKASQGKAGIIDNSFNVEGFLSYPAVAPSADNDKDGMADDWETAKGLNPADQDDRNKVTLSGYTALEVYLNSLMGETIPLEFSSGFKDNSLENTRVYPSIFDNEIEITGINLSKATIFHLNGSKVISQDISGVSTLNTSKLERGIYFIRIEDTSKNTINFKIIKQ